MASNLKTYIRIRPKAQVNELKFHGHLCCGPSLEAIVTPWCPLIPQDAPPPHSVPYMQMHLMKESRSDTIDGIYQIYKDRDKLEVLFIIAREEQHQPFSPPDLRFRIIFISRRHKKDVLELAEKGHDLEVTVNITESKNEVMRALMPQESENFATLIKVVHYVIQNRVTVSLSSGISEYPNICPEDKRVLSCFLDFLCYQSLENHIDVQLAVSSSVNCIFHLLHQPIHFDYMFPKDFIFYFDLAYTNYSNESVEKSAHLVMIHYLHELKKVPIETVAEQVEHFVKLGDFKAEMGGITNLSSVFEHTAKAFSKHCELYFKGGEISELFHVTLLSISIGVKINNFSDKKLAKKYDHIWNKKFNEYYRSGFNQNDLLCLEKGLKAMTTILESTPHLMSEWKDFNFILSSKVHSFEIMKEFITQSVKYLIKSGEDVSFRIDFLQPLTDMCLVASRRKKMASHFSVDTNNVIKEGKEFLACLISLIDEQKWNGYDYYTILENWMKIIFNLIDLSEESHKSQLFQWIHEGQINSSYFDYEYSFNKEYYKSGFNQVEVRCLEEGSKAMTIILEGSPHLMAQWKDFYVIFSSKDHTFETMKEFITHVKYLIKSGKDGSFRIDFLQPLTDMCLNASRKKKMASHFSVDANNVIKEGKEFLTCLILLIDEQKWNGHDYSTILENWMRIIFNLINLSEQLDESQLLQWIREGQINSSYFDYEYSFNKKLEDFLLRSQNLSAESLVSILSAVSSKHFDNAKVIIHFQDNLCIQYYS